MVLTHSLTHSLAHSLTHSLTHSQTGTEIIKSMRILALQQLPNIEIEIRNRAVTKRKEKEEKAIVKAKTEPAIIENDRNVTVEDVDGDSDTENNNKDNELTEHCPEVRVEIYQQLAKEKKGSSPTPSLTHSLTH